MATTNNFSCLTINDLFLAVNKMIQSGYVFGVVRHVTSLDL